MNLMLFAFVAVVSAHDMGLPINPELGVPGFPDCIQAKNNSGSFLLWCLWYMYKRRFDDHKLSTPFLLCCFVHSDLNNSSPLQFPNPPPNCKPQRALPKPLLPSCAPKSKRQTMMWFASVASETASLLEFIRPVSAHRCSLWWWWWLFIVHCQLCVFWGFIE